MASNPLSKVKDTFAGAVNRITEGAQKLRGGGVDSQVSRGEQVTPDSEPAVGKARELVELGNARFEESRQGRMPMHENFFTGLAFYNGLQNHFWNANADDGNGLMQPFPGSGGGNPDFQERFMHTYENLIRVKADQAAARITAAYPDAFAAPLTDSDKDRKAAQVLRSVNAHCSRVNRREQLLRRAILNTELTTTDFIECGWNAKAVADIGLPQPDGSIKYDKAPIGDVHNSLLLAIDAYPDPNAAVSGQGIHGGAYFIKRCIRSTSYIAEKWGKTVQATAPSSTYGYLRQRLEMTAGDHSRTMSRMQKATEVTEVWEKPSKLYPAGRFWVYSGDGTILWAGDWPYEKKDRYPFVELYFEVNEGSIWGLNLVRDAIEVQRTLNRLATYLKNRLEWDRPVLMLPDNSEIAPDDLQNPAYGTIVPYVGQAVGGEKPSYLFPPPPGDFYFAYEKSLLNKLEMIFGVHDFNADQSSPPSSGYEFELRMQEDKSRLGPVIRRYCQAVVEINEWDGALYRQFGASFPRLLGLDDKAVTPDDLQVQGAAATALVDIQALKDGSCRVVLQPGSGESKLPAAQEEELQELIKACAGLPPPLVKLYLKQSSVIRNDAELDRFMDDYAQYMQQQDNQAANVQQMKGQQAQEQLQMKAEQEQQAAQIQIQAEQEKAGIAVHSSSLEQQWRMEADQSNEQQRFQNAMALLKAKNATPSISLTADLTKDPEGFVSAGEQAGLDMGDPKDIAKIVAPPKPAPSTSQPKGKTNGTS